MAGRAKAWRNNREAQYTREMFSDEIVAARRLIAESVEPCIKNLLILANGVRMQGDPDKDGNPTYFLEPPHFGANVYLVNRLMGMPRPEDNPAAMELDKARMALIHKQVECLVDAQVQELLSRTRMKTIEAEMWPRQFVTEEEEQRNIQSLAAAVNRPLLMMTAETFAAIAPGVEDPSEALERLKGIIGRSQAEIVSEVLGRGTEEEGEEGEEEE